MIYSPISCRECGATIIDILQWQSETCSDGGGHKLRPVQVEAVHLRELAQSDQRITRIYLGNLESNEEGEWLL